MALFIALMLVVGKRVLPWLLWQVARTGSRELFTLCVIAVAVGIAYGSSELFGVSFALGAFFAGMVMRESELSHRAADESLPLRDAFSVLFFVSVGMLFDPQMLVREPLRMLVVLAIIMAGKTLAAFVLVLAFRYPLNTALTVSASLAQIGEFSFILASLGVALNLLPTEGQDLIFAGALFSIALNPLAVQPDRAGASVDPRALARSRASWSARATRSRSCRPLRPARGSRGTSCSSATAASAERIGAALAERGYRSSSWSRIAISSSDLRKRGLAAVRGDAADPRIAGASALRAARGSS